MAGMCTSGWHNSTISICMLERDFGTKGITSSIFCSGAATSECADPALPECKSRSTREAASHHVSIASHHAPIALQENQESHGASIVPQETRESEMLIIQMELMDDLPSIGEYIDILQKCRKEKDLAYGMLAHIHICGKGLNTHCELGNYLVPMLVECGHVLDAELAFNRLQRQNENSWTSLMHSYIKCGESQQAFNLFKKMQDSCVSPSEYTLVTVLRACARLKCVEKGQELYTEIAKEGYDKDPFVGNTLMDMYAKCGSLAEARNVFDELVIRNVVSWTALMAVYVEEGLAQEALNCLEQMEVEHVSPNAVTFVCSLKACGSIGATDKGREIHAEISKKGLEGDLFVGNTLLDTYSKCGAFAEAHTVFDRLAVRDNVSWNALITGYVEHRLGEKALNCFEWMTSTGGVPDAVTFVCALKACSSIQALGMGQKIHDIVAIEGCENDLMVGNSLVYMYAKCGSPVEARALFDELSGRDIVTWNALMAGYVENELAGEALSCLDWMQLEGAYPDAITFASSLKACGSLGVIDRGQELHAEIVKVGVEMSLFVCSALVVMYAACSLLAEAQEVFNTLPVKDVVSWTALIAGYAEQGLFEEALKFLKQMQLEGMPPDTITFASILKVCGRMGAIDKGQELHTETIKEGIERDPLLGNTLVDMYANCGLLAEAQEVFEELLDQDVVSWNALLRGYAKYRCGEEVLKYFNCMQQGVVAPNAVTYVWTLKACSIIEDTVDRGQEIHVEVVKKAFEIEHCVGNGLVEMYAKCDSLMEAQEVFNKLLVRDVVSWTVLITGYAERGLNKEALNCFQQMQLQGISADVALLNTMILGYAEEGESVLACELHAGMQEQGLLPNYITYVSILKACGNAATLETGKRLHAQIWRVLGPESTPLILTNALIDMYGKCGSMAYAQQVFDAVLIRDLVTWTGLMTGYARLGDSETVFHLFARLRKEGIQPDGITFLSVLTVCSHTGLVDMGQNYFEVMSRDYEIAPTIEHHNCILDLLGRAGQLTVSMLESTSFPPNLVTWKTVLGACDKWNSSNLELARHASKGAMKMEEKDAAAFILMMNIYADAHILDDADCG